MLAVVVSRDLLTTAGLSTDDFVDVGCGEGSRTSFTGSLGDPAKITKFYLFLHLRLVCWKKHWTHQASAFVIAEHPCDCSELSNNLLKLNGKQEGQTNCCPGKVYLPTVRR